MQSRQGGRYKTEPNSNGDEDEVGDEDETGVNNLNRNDNEHDQDHTSLLHSGMKSLSFFQQTMKTG